MLFSTLDFLLKVQMQSFFEVPVWKRMNSHNKWKMELDVMQSLVERTNNVEDTIKTQIWTHQSSWDVAKSKGSKLWKKFIAIYFMTKQLSRKLIKMNMAKIQINWLVLQIFIVCRVLNQSPKLVLWNVFFISVENIRYTNT